MTISLFIPCFVDLMFPQVGISSVRIFEKLGHKVVVPKAPACCGQPAFNTGYWDESREIAIKVMEALKDAEVDRHRQRFVWRDDEGVLPRTVRRDEIRSACSRVALPRFTSSPASS
jgi:Fe-S oxidoreductase